MRTLYSVNKPCRAGCIYCFAKWKDIYDGQPLLESAVLDKDSLILYPSCDGEFFDQDGIVDAIKAIAKRTQKTYVSISTKCGFLPAEFNNIVLLDQWLKAQKKGFVKFSVSVSTKTKIPEIEPLTADYRKRLSIAQQLKNLDIYSSLTLKPILPFIPIEEYFEIIEDFSPYIKHMTVGGLYVNFLTDFYKNYIQDKYTCTTRRVSWLDSHPEWHYVEDEERIHKIMMFATKQGVQAYLSDEELIKSIINRM